MLEGFTLTRKKLIIAGVIVVLVLSVIGIIVKLNTKQEEEFVPLIYNSHNNETTRSENLSQYFSKEELELIKTEFKAITGVDLERTRIQRDSFVINEVSKEVILDAPEIPMSYEVAVSKLPDGGATVFIECAPDSVQIGNNNLCSIDRGVDGDYGENGP